MTIDDTSNDRSKRVITGKKVKYKIQFCKVIFDRGFSSFRSLAAA